MDIKNKNVFVTGSTRGIGLAIAHRFASLGANVVLNGRSEISAELINSFKDLLIFWLTMLVSQMIN